MGDLSVGRSVLHVCGRGGLALCVISVFLPFWLVYPIKGSIVLTSMLLSPGGFQYRGNIFDGESKSSRSLPHMTLIRVTKKQTNSHHNLYQVLKLNRLIHTLHSFIFLHFDMSSYNHLPFEDAQCLSTSFLDM
jgi:hypothetical protein